MAIDPGDVVVGLSGTYRVEGRHREGSFGITYDARDVASGMRLVLKELRVEKLSDWKALDLFEREGRVLSTLSHPNIPAFRDFFVHGGPHPLPVSAMTSYDGPGRMALVLVQEFIAGVTLQQRIDQGQCLLPREAEAVLRTLLSCLIYLHSRTPPLVHRDIKPSNVILTPEGRPFLVDFGAIQDRLRHAGSVGSTIVGTLGYMPLEQIRGDARPASDLYALGVTLIVALAGRPLSELPFDDRTGKVSIARSVPRETPKALRAALDTMIAPLVGQRAQSAAEVLSRLDAAGRPPAPVRRGLALAALGVGGVAAIAGIGLSRTKSTPAPPQIPVTWPQPPGAVPPPSLPPQPVVPQPVGPQSNPFARRGFGGPCAPDFPPGLFVQNAGTRNALVGPPPTQRTRPTLAGDLLNIDFGSNVTTKVGVAAAGAAPTDVWNPVGPGFQPDYLATGLDWADGTHSSVIMRVQNFPGNWGAKSVIDDPMLNNYTYSWSGSSATITIASLPAGKYDFYIYAVVPNGDTGVSVATCKSGTIHPLQRTSTKGYDSDTIWRAGEQYVVEEGVDVAAADLVILSFVHGVQGTGNAGIVLNGMQIVRLKGSSSSPVVEVSRAGITPGGGTTAFDRSAAAGALSSVNVATCKSLSGPIGPGHVAVTFAPDGSVMSAIVDQPPFAGTPVAGCVSNAFRAVHVPAFTGQAVKVGKSFVVN